MPLIKKENIRKSNNVRILGKNAVSVSMSENESTEESSNISVEDYIKNSNEYKREYQKLIEAAEREAQKTREAALKDIAEKRAAAVKSGLAEGQQKGYNEMAAKIKEAVKIIEQAKAQRDEIIKSNEPETLRLAVKIAREIIKKEMAADQTIIMQILEEAIEKISDNEQVVIKVSHNDLQEVRNHKDRIIDLVEAKNLSIVSDKHIEDGGCVIETKLGYIDAKIKTKLEIIEEGLLGVYEEDKIKEETMAKEQEMKKELEDDLQADDLLEEEKDLADEEETAEQLDEDDGFFADEENEAETEEDADLLEEDDLEDDFASDFSEDEKDEL